MKKTFSITAIILFSFYAYCQSPKTVENKVNEDSSLEIPNADSSSVFTIVEVMPTFSGGEKARQHFLATNLIYPQTATKNHIQGTVYISFIIESDGSVTNVKTLRGIGGGCDEEAERVIKMMPKWIPGRQKGKPVRVLFNTPIYFKLKK